jgi:hypothetical protein
VFVECVCGVVRLGCYWRAGTNALSALHGELDISSVQRFQELEEQEMVIETLFCTSHLVGPLMVGFEYTLICVFATCVQHRYQHLSINMTMNMNQSFQVWHVAPSIVATRGARFTDFQEFSGPGVFVECVYGVVRLPFVAEAVDAIGTLMDMDILQPSGMLRWSG